MSWLEQLLKILTLRCEEASVLTSRELDEPLGLAERLAVRSHTLVCGSCRRFRRQVQFLRAALIRRDAAALEDGPGPDTLSPEARVRIKRALLQASRDHDGPDEPG
jgi:hypothetical protein